MVRQPDCTPHQGLSSPPPTFAAKFRAHCGVYRHPVTHATRQRWSSIRWRRLPAVSPPASPHPGPQSQPAWWSGRGADLAKKQRNSRAIRPALRRPPDQCLSIASAHRMCTSVCHSPSCILRYCGRRGGGSCRPSSPPLSFPTGILAGSTIPAPMEHQSRDPKVEGMSPWRFSSPLVAVQRTIPLPLLVRCPVVPPAVLSTLYVERAWFKPESTLYAPLWQTSATAVKNVVPVILCAPAR